MTEPAAPRDIVHVAAETTLALSQPSFIIERGGRFYLTVALLEYDPKAPGLTPEQRDGVAQIEKLYRSGPKGLVGATEVAMRGGGGPMNTGPMNTQAH